jgi:hypothetical protein
MTTPSPSPPPLARADDETPEACVHALYTVISGPPDAPRDWARFRRLCRPDARFLLATRGPDGAPLTQAFDVDAFVAEGTRSFAQRGLWERELVGRSERFGRVAHVFSSYESRLDRPDAPVVSRGVNSIQLVEEPDGGWRIAHLTWDRVPAEQPLPPTWRGGAADPEAPIGAESLGVSQQLGVGSTTPELLARATRR